MIVGILADTHDDRAMTVKAVDVLRSREVDVVLHAGDLTSPEMLEYLGGFHCYVVLGNGDVGDGNEEAIRKKGIALGFNPIEYKIEVELGGKMFALFHGDNVPMFREAVACGRFDYIVKGHTHFYENYISNGARIINPGAVSVHDEASVVTVETESGNIEKIEL